MRLTFKTKAKKPGFGYNDAQARQIFRDLIDMPADVTITDGEITLRFHRRAHLPIASSPQGSSINPLKCPGGTGAPSDSSVAFATELLGRGSLGQRRSISRSATLSRPLAPSGLRIFRIMVRELLPNLVPPISAIVVLSMSRIIVIEGTLSFLGLSLPPPAPTWGNMIAAGVSELAFHPAISFVPAGVMFITILALVVISDALRRASDLRDTAL